MRNELTLSLLFLASTPLRVIEPASRMDSPASALSRVLLPDCAKPNKPKTSP